MRDTREFEDRLCAGLLAMALPPCRAAVAVSGGPDSVALAHLMHVAAGRTGLEPVLVHVDHGIAPDSADVARLVSQLGRALGREVLGEALHLGPDASETRARHARWMALNRLRRRAGASWIVTAHHQDDQVETVAMRFLRGSGPAGLAGMAMKSGHVLRPLLPFRREELAWYVQAIGLTSWRDPANEDVRHDRAWIRHRLLPEIETRRPRVRADLNRAASEAARWRRAWHGLLRQLPELDLQEAAGVVSVAGAVLAGYDSDLGWAVARSLAEQAGIVISSRSAERVIELARSGASGKWVPLGGGWRATNAFGRVRLERPEPEPSMAVLGPDGGDLQWGRWRFRAVRDRAPVRQVRRGLSAWFPLAAAEVRGARAGERMRPIGAPGHRLLVRLMQDERIPVTQRCGWPLIVIEGRPSWLPGICRDGTLLPAPETEALRIDAVHE